jgi:hypothetical protein
MNEFKIVASFLCLLASGPSLVAGPGGGSGGTIPSDSMFLLPGELMQLMNAPTSQLSTGGDAFVVYQDGFVYDVTNPDQTLYTVDQTFDFGNQSYLHLVNPANLQELAIQSSNPVDVLKLKEEKTLHVFIADDEGLELMQSEPTL